MTDDFTNLLRNIDWEATDDQYQDMCADAADEIDRLRSEINLLTHGYNYLLKLVETFSEHCQCETSSATMLIVHRAAMKLDPYAASIVANND
jgi:hypothetical protein